MKCRVYDAECINAGACTAADACCAGDPDVPVKRSKPQVCKACGGTGHNARTCGQTDEQRRANRRGKP